MRASTRTLGLARSAAILFAALALSRLPLMAQSDVALGELVINGESRGSMELLLDPSGGVLLGSDAVKSILSGIVKPSIIDTVAGRDRPIGADELRLLGISVSFDKVSLVLSMDIAPKAMATSRLGVSAAAQGRRGEALVKNAAFAATLGSSLELDPTYRRAGTSESSSLAAKAELKPAIRALGIVAEGDLSFAYDESGFSWSLTAARALADFPRLGARLSGGIVGVSPTSFQTGQELYGLSFARDASLPGAAKPLHSLSDDLILSRTADVTVEVNGVATSQKRLSPGSYRLSDIALSSGLNEVRVIIDEAGSPRRVIQLGLPFDEALLGSGVFDYAIALGTARDDPDEPYGAARASLGLGDFLQLGADAEAGYGSALAGLSALAATPLGSLGVSGALEFDLLDPGKLLEPAYAARAFWRFSSPGHPYAPRLGAAAEYESAGFSAPAKDAVAKAASLGLSAQVGMPLGKIGGLSAFGDLSIVEDRLARWSATLGLSFAPAVSTFVSLSGGYDWKADSGYAPRLAVSLTLAPSDQRGLSYRQDLLGGKSAADLSLGLGKDRKASVDLYGEGLVGEGADRVVDLSGRARTGAIAVAGSGRYYRDGEGGGSELSGRASASTTLAFADGAFAATSESGSALAILLPSSELRGQRVEFRPADCIPTSSDSGRAAAVTGLTPYVDYVAQIELPASSPDARPSPSSVELRPEYRSIALVRVGLAPSIAVRGVLTDPSGARVANMPGDVVDGSGSALSFSGTFTDEGGVFECYGLAPGHASIRWGDGRVTSLNVPAGDSGSVVDLGIVLAMKPVQEGGAK